MKLLLFFYLIIIKLNIEIYYAKEKKTIFLMESRCKFELLMRGRFAKNSLLGYTFRLLNFKRSQRADILEIMACNFFLNKFYETCTKTVTKNINNSTHSLHAILFSIVYDKKKTQNCRHHVYIS